MRFRLEGYAAAQKTLRRRSLWCVLIGGPTGLWGGFWTLALFTHWIVYGDGKDTGLEVAMLVVFGLLPLFFSGYLIRKWWSERVKLGHLRQIASVAMSSGGHVDANTVSSSLSVPRHRAEQVLMDAAELGVIFTEPPMGHHHGYHLAAGHAGHAYPRGPEAQAPHAAPPAAYAPPRAPAHRPQPPAPIAVHGPQAASGVRRSAAAETLVGQQLGHYRIEQYLAAGAMGAVYIARHARTGRRYAVKTLLRDAGSAAAHRFEREALAASNLGHPGIVSVHDYDVTPAGVAYLVMDLLEGETLERRLARLGTLPWPAARQIARELASALGAAHEAGLLHRDLKPANVFLALPGDGSERAMLLDFGLVKPLNENAAKLTATGAAVGTPLYMAPEQARGETLDVRADVYGLAAVLYEMVTGAPPFIDHTLAGVYAKLLNERAAPPSSLVDGCPAGFDAVMATALAKQRDSRYPTVAAFATALDQLDTGYAVAATHSA